MKLYPYQEKNHNEIFKLWEEYQSVLYQLPTGGGKTVVINSIIEKILDKKILILVHRREIIFQIKSRLKARGIKVGVLIGNYEEHLDADILIGSILTVARDTRLEDILSNNYDYMIIDEAHHACSSSYLKTIHSFKSHNPSYKLLGVTATPYRKDGKPLNKVFDVMLKGPTYSQLRNDGYLSDYICYAAKLEGLSEVDLSGGDFKISSLSKYMRSEWLLNKAIQMYKDKGENKQMLVFCVDKKHALQTKKAYENVGYKSIAIIDSDTDSNTRNSINKLYRDKKLQIIISIQTLTEGVDLPDTRVVQLLRPTLSLVLYLQILGRGTRLKSDGSKLIILDLSNNSYQHGLLDSKYEWSLDNKEPNISKKINKIGGRNKKGKFTIDVGEIEEEYLEIEEMSHEDYLLENQDGIEIAEKENNEKDKLIESSYKKLANILTEKIKNPNIKFNNWKDNLIKYSYWNEMEIKYKGNQIATLIYNKGILEYNLYWNNTRFKFNELEKIIILGKIGEFFNKKNIHKLILESFLEMKNIIDSKIDIRNLKNKIYDIELEKCIFKINEQLKNKNYKFKLNNEVNTNYLSSRNYWGYFDTIIFNDNPKKIKVNNNITVIITKGGGNNEYPNLNKEKLIEILYNYWYKK